MTNFNILSACPGQAEVIGIWHHYYFLQITLKDCSNALGSYLSV